MNIKEYISSGIVESYVFGLADEAERVEFEKLCAEYAEVRAAREAFEILVEQQSIVNAIETPKHLKDKIFAEIENENIKRSSPVIPLSASKDFTSKGAVASTNLMRYLAAASVILLLASTALNWYLFRQYKDYSARYSNLLTSQQQLASNNSVIQAKLQSYESAMELIKNPGMAVVQMQGTNVKTSPDSNSLATVYWDKRTKDVYLIVNNMPEPTTDKQYQLWALVDGKPVDMGVFDTKTEIPLVKMKNIPNAQAFAVTLEKKGGSPSPTMEQMYVLGNVTI